jgi:hypothetical protein
MTSNVAKNEMQVMVLTDLAGICKKLAENSAVPEHLRVRARECVEEYESLSPYLGKTNEAQHASYEFLLGKMARLLPHVLEVEAEAPFDRGDVP